MPHKLDVSGRSTQAQSEVRVREPSAEWQHVEKWSDRPQYEPARVLKFAVELTASTQRLASRRC